MQQRNQIQLPEIHPFSFTTSYVDIDRDAPENQHEHHVHAECEIYLNLSGDVSFMADDHIYPIAPGSIIITKPYEYHHCIYHSNAIHKHYWILFSAEGNESLLELFFHRKSGEQNLLIVPPQELDRLISILEQLMREELSPAEKYFYFFSLLDLLNHSKVNNKKDTRRLSPDLVFAMQYLSENPTSQISIPELARLAHVSLNTLERHFLKSLRLSPTEYRKRRRLSLSMELLRGGATVSEACFESGFSDCSSYIAYFKQQTGLTPLQYKKKQVE